MRNQSSLFEFNVESYLQPSVQKYQVIKDKRAGLNIREPATVSQENKRPVHFSFFKSIYLPNAELTQQQVVFESKNIGNQFEKDNTLVEN